MALPRIIVSNHAETYKFEIDPAQVIDARTVEEINGEHSLTVTTLQELEKADRLLLRDGMGLWHEYVVLGITEEHTDGGAVSHEYYCVWSLQHDLSATFVDDLYGCGYNPGRPSTPQTATRALECALEGTSRWTIGLVTQTTQSSASFYRRSGWEGMQTVIERWGGELSATIEVTTTGVAGRRVNLLSHVGTRDATRRFDYGHDVTGIKRTVSDEVWPCRIVPLGKSEETDAGGYTRRPSIDSVNGGIPWVEDASAVPLTRQPDGKGGWEYPTLIVKNETYSEPGDLKAWAVEHVSEYCRPIVSYEADVVQFEQAGMDPHGVALGDEVAIVDRAFCEGGLRIAARVVKMERSLLDPADIKLTIGNGKDTLAGQLSGIAVDVARLTEQSGNSGEYQATADYLSSLLTRLNDEANATGGYTYITEGNGLRTYDKAVTDPLVGAEATSVVEVKGGTIRIANSRTAAGDWDWKTVFTSGHIAAELVTAAKITTGYIGDSVNGNHWDLDAGELMLRMAANYEGDPTPATPETEHVTEVTTEHGLISSAEGMLGVLNGYYSSLAPDNVISFKIASRHKFRNVDRGETGHILITPLEIPLGDEPNRWGSIASSTGISLISNYTGESTDRGRLKVHGKEASLQVGNGTTIKLTPGEVYASSTFRTNSANIKKIQSGADNDKTGSVEVYGSLRVYGTSKTRVMETVHYNDRMLYCYETPTPQFGDLGSSKLGGDGCAYISIDDIFSETARTDFSYQVFLQKCGKGDLWVEEKHQNYFVVMGTPGLSFDWEIKATQVGCENFRLDECAPIDNHSDEQGEVDSLTEAIIDMDDSEGEAQRSVEAIERTHTDPAKDLERIFDKEVHELRSGNEAA